jgi:hypothetical protein
MMISICENSPIKKLGINEGIFGFDSNNFYSFSLRQARNKVKVILSIHGEDNKMFWYVTGA